MRMPDGPRPLWIDRKDTLADLAARCRVAGRFALDTEADSLHSYFHKVCLVQVTVRGEHAVIDPLALGADDLLPLWEVCGDRKISVVMHGADYDVRILDRDHDARIAGLEDTQIMAQLLGEKKTGLASLLEAHFGIRLDKKHQRADWGRRPLKPSMLRYAAEDTAHLEALAGRLRGRLEALGRWGWAREEFARLEKVRHLSAEPNPLAFERIKGVSALKGPARDRAYSLFQWRDAEARKRNVPPFKILGNQPLVDMAREIPQDLKAMEKIPGLGPRFVGRNGREVLKVLRNPQPAPERIRRERAAPVDPAVRARTKLLTAARDVVAADLGIEPSVICPRAVIERVAEGGNGALENGVLEGWRLEILAEPFAKVLADS